MGSLPKLADFYRKHQDKKEHFEIIAIDCVTKTIPELKKHLKKFEKSIWKNKALPFPVMLDKGRKTTAAYKTTAYPTAYLINPEGKIVKIDHHGVEKILEEKLLSIKKKQ